MSPSLSGRSRRLRAPGAALVGAAAALVLVPVVPDPVAAHALGSSFPLPVPLWLYLAGAAIAVAASFVVAVIVVKPPADTPRYPTRTIPEAWARWGGTILKVIGLAWWYGAILTGLLIGGITYLPAVLFWIGIWVAVPMAAALLGNPWPALSPFRTTHDLLDAGIRWLFSGRRLDLGLPLPPIGRWPAVVLLFVFLILELVWPDRLNPISIAVLLSGYTVVTLLGMTLFGSVTWLRSFELFDILNGWFGRVGPMGRRTRRAELCVNCTDGCNPAHCVDCAECVAARDGDDQGVELRWWVTGLTETTRTGWSDAAFIVMALAGVTFDGLQETSLGTSILSALFTPLSTSFGPLAASYLSPVIMLAGVFGVFMLVFATAADLTRRLGERGGDGTPGATDPATLAPLGQVAGAYAPTLLPIAAGYLVAHYLTLVLQGAVWLPQLVLDPATLAPTLDVIPTAAIWYLSVGAIVAGHIAAVVLAHRLALRDQAWRPIVAGLPLVIVMIGYTVLSLWIIAQPIVVEPK
jgi:hypothetical protein